MEESPFLLQFLQSAFDELPIGVSVFDQHLRLVRANAQFADLLDFPEPMLAPGTHLAQFLRYNAHRGDYGLGDPEAQVAERIALAEKFEAHCFERERPNGQIIEICGRPMPGGGFITTYTDITAQRKAERGLRLAQAELERRVADRTATLKKREQELAEKARLLELTLDNMEQGITYVDGDLNAVLFSQHALQLLDLPLDFAQGNKRFEDVMRFNAERGEYGPGDVETMVAERVAIARRGEPHLFRRRRPDGRVIEVRGRPVSGGGFVTTYTDVTHQQAMEDELRTERDRLKTLIDGIPDGVSMFDGQLRLIAHNQRFEELLDMAGFLRTNPNPTLEEFGWFNAERGEYGAGNAAEKVSTLLAKAREKQPHMFQRMRPNGTVLEVRGAPLADGGFVTIYSDITDRRRYEHEISRRHAYLAEVVAHIPVGLTVFDENLALRYWNEEAMRVLDVPREAWYPGVPFADLIMYPARRGEYGPGIPEELVAQRVELARRFQAHRFERTRPNGNTHLVNGSPMRVEGKVIGFITTYSDITDRKRDESVLRELLGRHRAILDSSEYAIVATNEDGVLLEFNRGAEKLLGYKAEDVIGKQTPLMWHVPEEVAARQEALADSGLPVERDFDVFVHLARQGAAATSEWQWVDSRGKRFPVALSVSPVGDKDGNVLGFLGVGRDISKEKADEAAIHELNTSLERRVAERTAALARANEDLALATQRLVQVEKQAALGRLVAGVAHELNTPLGNMLTTASATADRVQAFREEMALGPVKRSQFNHFVEGLEEAASLIERNAQRAARLIQDFKELAFDQSSSRRRLFDVRKVLEDTLGVLEPVLSKSPVRVVLDAASGLEMDSHPGPIEQIVENLVMNALHHAFPEGAAGEVHVTVELAHPEWVELTVCDDGLGMDEETARRAFDPFFTTKLGQGGTGLGLFIVHGLAHGVLGGSVHLESVQGRGSSFLVRMPRVVQAAPKLAADSLNFDI